MATNFIQPGKNIDYVASSDIESGDVVILGSRCGVALTDIANGSTGSVATEGVWDLPCKSADVIEKYDDLYYDAENEELTLTSSGNTFAGMAVTAAGNGVITVKVKLLGPAKPAGASHYVVAAGEHTTEGGDANESIAVAGALATDLVTVTLHTVGSTPRTILTAQSAEDAVNVVMSGDPSTDHVLTYVVLRAFV